MSPTANETHAGPLGALYAPVRDDLEQVEVILRREMSNPHPFVDELVQYGCLLGGKRLRPALLLLTAKACGQVVPEHWTLAAVVEMIHTATLIHDDVLDEAVVRRHLATVNARWNNECSVLLGDYLFSHAFYMAATLESTYACRLIGRSTNVVCEGEIRQIGSRSNFELDEADYLSIIEGKTAELCACSCELGAHYAGAPLELVTRLNGFGRNLGMAFQIADDLLDLTGDEATVGKSLGTDLEKQKPTLPVIHALRQADESTRRQLQGLLEEPSASRVGELLSYLERYESLGYARGRAEEYARRAAEALDPLPKSAARDVLHAVCDFVVSRSR